MNIAIVHPYPVHAAAVGGVTRVYELARFLARRHRVSIFTHAVDGEPSVDAELTRLGVISRTFPRPEPTWRSKAGGWIGAAPYYVHRNYNPGLTAALAAADRSDPFDVVQLELGYMAPVLAGLGHRAVRVLAEQEAMPFVLDRLRQIPWRDRTRYERLAVFTGRSVAQFDRGTLPAFDLIYGITPREQIYLQTASGRAAGVLPHIVSMARFPAGAGSTDRAPSVLFVGNFAHRPNVHGVTWFVERVWPRVVAAVPSARFEIVGSGISIEQAARLAAPGVVLRGYEADLVARYRAAAVAVIPLHSGGGMRGKALEACAAECALVSTPLGIDGIAAVPGRHCLTGETPEQFAAAVIAYLNDPALRASHGAAAREMVGELYDAPVVFGRLERDYEAAHRDRATLPRRSTA
jgi:glycosyltransferase involved in cell wall biosynthesis